MRFRSIVAVGAAALFSHFVAASDFDQSANNVASGLDLLNEMQQLQASLSNVQSLLASSGLQDDPAVMDKAAKLFRRVRWLVYAADKKNEELKKSVPAAQHHTGTNVYNSNQLRGDMWGSDPAQSRVTRSNLKDDIQRDLYDSTITFPECQEKFLEDCLQIISAQLAELEMECDIIIHEKRTIDQESYNKVVIVTDLTAEVVKGKNNDGKVSYPFMWDDAEQGLRVLGVDGKWDCNLLSPEACCDLIKSSVPNPDTRGNYIQCHIFVPFGGVGNIKRSDRVFVNLSQDGRVHESPIIQ